MSQQVALVQKKESNCDILLRAVKDMGGVADKWQLFDFLWINLPDGKHIVRSGYERHKRSWAVDRIQHDLSILCDEDKLLMVKDGPDHFTYYLSEKELWN